MRFEDFFLQDICKAALVISKKRDDYLLSLKEVEMLHDHSHWLLDIINI